MALLVNALFASLQFINYSNQKHQRRMFVALKRLQREKKNWWESGRIWKEEKNNLIIMRIITVIINIYGYSNTATESEAHLLFKWRQRFIVMLSSCSRINNLNNNHFCSCTYVFGLFAKMLIVPASWFPHNFLEESQHGDASINSKLIFKQGFSREI